MKKNLYGVYGASGFGREVMPLARDQVNGSGEDVARLVFIDDNIVERTINGHAVMTYDEFMRVSADNRYVALAIADGTVRERLFNRLHSDGVKEWSILAGNSTIMDAVDIGEGVILCPFVTVTSNIKIGKSFQANIYSYVAHDCQIGDFVTFAPGVKCNGNVLVEDHAYIGTGAIIKQGRPGRPIIIGRGAVVGMGAVVTKNVPAGSTVIGNPAKPLSKENLRK